MEGEKALAFMFSFSGGNSLLKNRRQLSHVLCGPEGCPWDIHGCPWRLCLVGRRVEQGSEWSCAFSSLTSLSSPVPCLIPFNNLPLGSVFFLAAAVLRGEWLLPWRTLCPQRAGHPPRSSVRALRAQLDPLALLLGSNTNLRNCQVKHT